MGKLKAASERVGMALPETGHAQLPLGDVLHLSRAADPAERRVAVRNLCTCNVKADDDLIWERLLDMVRDPDPGVRRDVLHSVTDSTPGPRVDSVVAALESLHNDPDARLRRRVRKTLAHYRRTGKITDGPG